MRISLIPVVAVTFLSSILLSATAQAQTPTLSAELSTGSGIQLSWPATDAAYQLEQTAGLSPGTSWVEVTAARATLNGRTTVTVPAATDRAYFRLRQVAGVTPSQIAQTSPAAGETGVSVYRETIVTFSEPLAAGTLLRPETFYAEALGRRVLGRIELAADRRRATLHPLEPLPGSARVRVHFVGDGLLDAQGQLVDADGNGVAGGVFALEYDTMPTTGLTGTAVVGQVFASDPVPSGTGFTNRPLAGVEITVDGAEERIRATTDANGFFRLIGCPSGRFFVHIDGRPALGSDWPNGAYYPFVGKTFEAVAGQTNNLAGGTGEIFLPLIAAGSLKSVSALEPTTITIPSAVVAKHPELAGLSLTVPPNALYADAGTRGGKVGLAPVAPDRLPSPLPAG